jgi:hypothetical protein
VPDVGLPPASSIRLPVEIWLWLEHSSVVEFDVEKLTVSICAVRPTRSDLLERCDVENGDAEVLDDILCGEQGSHCINCKD